MGSKLFYFGVEAHVTWDVLRGKKERTFSRRRISVNCSHRRSLTRELFFNKYRANMKFCMRLKILHMLQQMYGEWATCFAKISLKEEVLAAMKFVFFNECITAGLKFIESGCVYIIDTICYTQIPSTITLIRKDSLRTFSF